MTQRTSSATHRAWWKDALIYQVYPRSFADGNGDGIGDLQGIIDHLDYLQGLSVDGIWMSPCFPSPQRDHGYDVSDYFDINPEYGDLQLFDDLVAEGRKRGIRIMLDVVPNHCSIDHEWFQAALKAGRGSPLRERFYFRDGRGENGELPPNNWMSIFGGAAWSRVTEPDGTLGQWYLHVFDAGQPDMNWEHDDVKKHFDDMLTFWFDRGVEGFRVDAVAVVGKTAGLPDGPEPLPGESAAAAATRNTHFQHQEVAHGYWRRWRALIDRYEAEHPGRELVTVSEAYTSGDPMQLLRYVQPDQFHQSFAFDLMLAPWIARHIREATDGVYRTLSENGASLSWTLNNHDTQRSVTRYGRANADSEESFTGNNLVYNDSDVDLALGLRRHRAMLLYVAALPGAFYLYQGEEMGLPEWLDLPDDRREDPVFLRTGGKEKGRDGCRVPLPWSSDPTTSFGFSTPPVTGAPWLPQPTWWGDFNMAEHDGVFGSVLELYREVLAKRREIDKASELIWMLHDDPAFADDVVAFRRGTVLVVMNVTSRDVKIPESVIGSASVWARSEPVSGNVIPANSAVWYR